MIYTDGAHLIADSLQELFNYANKAGLNPSWIHVMGKTFHPHFDICGHVRRRVLADEGVQLVSRKELVRLTKLLFRLPETEQELNEWEAYHKKSVDTLPLPSASDYKRMFNNILTRSGLSRAN